MKKTHPIVVVLVALAVGALSAVSVAAQSSAPPVLRFDSIGHGTTNSVQTAEGTLGAPCDDVHDCSVSWSGVIRGLHIGRKAFQGSLTVLWSDSKTNGTSTGVCAPAQGTGTVTAADGDQLDLTFVGTECETGALSPSSPHAFNLTFSVSGGTGRFSNAAGSGNFVASDDGIAQSGTGAGTGNLMFSALGVFQR